MPDTRQHFFYFFTIFLSHVIIRSQFPITRTMTNGRTIWASMQGGWPSATLSKRVVCLQRLTELAPPFDSANPAKLSAIAETGWVRTGCRKEETAKGRNGDAEHVVYSPIPGSESLRRRWSRMRCGAKPWQWSRSGRSRWRRCWCRRYCRGRSRCNRGCRCRCYCRSSCWRWLRL